MKKNLGITLIALVITMIVLLILAGITIGVVFSDNGVIKKAQEAANAQNQAVENTKKEINDLTDDLKESLGEGSKKTFNETKGVNSPQLGIGMKAIKWNGSSWEDTTADDNDWYDYENKLWANAKTEDGSMWVWIPRYAYQIESGYHQSGENINSTNPELGAGKINIDFMKGTTNESASGRTVWDNSSGEGNWNIHPAFEYGETVPGIWVAKFEASQTDSGQNDWTYENYTGGTSGILKIQPGVNSWRNITVGNAYTICLNYNQSLNSHLMKNSEWGAIAYITQSKYGKNSEVSVNQCRNYITGAGPGLGDNEVYNEGYDYDANTFATTYAYTTTQGQKASTTGNITGIYDMSGGAFERLAAYVDFGSSVLMERGASLVNGAAKTKDVYESVTNQDKNLLYELAKKKYGDAVYETSITNIDTEMDNTLGCSWFYDDGSIPYRENYPFFVRGGRADSYAAYRAGLFCCGSDGWRKSREYLQTSSH